MPSQDPYERQRRYRENREPVRVWVRPGLRDKFREAADKAGFPSMTAAIVYCMERLIRNPRKED